jgi:hypothetical protein
VTDVDKQLRGQLDGHEDSRPLWAIATYDDGTRRADWPVSHAEIERAMGGALATLTPLGIRDGARVLWCSLLSEQAHLWPLMIGTMLSGGVFSLADATEADALRITMFARTLGLHAAFGINHAVLDGLDALGRGYVDVFGDIKVLGAHPGAYERLAAAGLRPHWFVLCGPAVAIAPEPGAPARVDAGEWSLDADGDRILATSLQPRAMAFDHAPTGTRGTLVDPTSFVPHSIGEA